MNSSAIKRIANRSLLAVCGVAAICSCNTLSSQGHGETIEAPVKWSRGSSDSKMDTASLSQWWKLFRDPVLADLINEGLRSSPDIRTATSRIAEARARRGVERANLFPTLNAGTSGQARRTDDRGIAVTSSENYGASVDASWQVDLFGKNLQSVKAASADLAQAQENYYAAQVSLAADIAEAYITLRQAEARLNVAENSLTTRGETTQITQWKKEAGTATELEALQANSILEQARADIPSLKQTIEQTRNQLALLCGRNPGTLNRLLTQSRPVPGVPSKVAIGIPAETLRQRPDIRAVERAYEAAVFRTKAAERERLPTLDITGSIGLEALKAGKLFSPETVVASAIGSLSAPLFDAGRIRQNIVIQNEQARQAWIAYEAAVLQALSEVENALVAIQRTAERLTVLDRATADAHEAAKLATQQFQAGQVDLLNVLEAQRSLLSFEEQQVNTRADQAAAHVQLYKALGGGWSSH